ncbi:Ribokinase-like protein [Hesseltinella vesiculosa]|uniref:pyridoxal kinase n=1 Tax=Hesseltinella vesiculosa TaxID=101127 RepID=A0A1X2GBR9_9FUNG|nr:Ribokinase-like protein [Hesseltinella vesiculosa]
MTDLAPEQYRVLSIQSHMVSGYCGNKAATFPLQTLGYDVDVLNTVQFSNHTGYPSWTGERLDAAKVQQLFDGLETNGLDKEYTHVLTGYIGNVDILKTIENQVKKLKEKRPNLIFVCDPVMGDNGRLYVSPEIVPLYREILTVADVITPNQFETETLSGIKITDLASAKLAAMKLHEEGGAKRIVITTLTLPSDQVPTAVRSDNGKATLDQPQPLYCMTSQVSDDGSILQHLISFPTFEGYFTGTGDLFSAMTVARLQDYPHSLAHAIYKVVCTVNAITRLTWEHQRKNTRRAISGKPADPNNVHACELRLIQGRKHIEHPDMTSSTILMTDI